VQIHRAEQQQQQHTNEEQEHPDSAIRVAANVPIDALWDLHQILSHAAARERVLRTFSLTTVRSGRRSVKTGCVDERVRCVAGNLQLVGNRCAWCVAYVQVVGRPHTVKLRQVGHAATPVEELALVTMFLSSPVRKGS
jgi:hypothetical protein